MTDALDDVMIWPDVDILSDMEIIAGSAPPITSKFVGVMVGWVKVPYTVGVLADLLTPRLIGVVPSIDADILADESMNGFVAMVTPPELRLSSP